MGKLKNRAMCAIYFETSFLCLLFCGFVHSVTVLTDVGDITGQGESLVFNGSQYSVVTFLGIPYAEPPTGDRRFHKPIKKLPFTQTFIANTLSPACLQPNAGAVGVLGRQDEDCLYLNLYIPGEQIDLDRPRAVMIWIYGGGFQMGSHDIYNSPAFVALNDVILVTFNYRISALGFLSTAENNLSGNYGLWDQHMAIKWVHDHISKFGGDTSRLTIFGESAGGASVIHQALYQGNAGLFQRVIAQSGTANNIWAYDTNPGKNYRYLANVTGCRNESQLLTINCLRSLSPSDMVASLSSPDVQYLPVVDGAFVKANPSDVFINKSGMASELLKHISKLDIIFGVTTAEGSVFLPLIDPLVEENTNNGYTMSAFENVVIPMMLFLKGIPTTNATHQAIVHEYIKWNRAVSDTSIVTQSIVNMASDAAFNVDIMKAALGHSESTEGGNTYFYVFDHQTQLSDPRFEGASHGDEIPYVLGFPQEFMSLFLPNFQGDPAELVQPADMGLSVKMMAYWSNFAKTGYGFSTNGPAHGISCTYRICAKFLLQCLC